MTTPAADTTRELVPAKGPGVIRVGRVLVGDIVKALIVYPIGWLSPPVLTIALGVFIHNSYGLIPSLPMLFPIVITVLSFMFTADSEQNKTPFSVFKNSWKITAGLVEGVLGVIKGWVDSAVERSR